MATIEPYDWQAKKIKKVSKDISKKEKQGSTQVIRVLARRSRL